MKIGERIHYLRIRSNLTSKELSKILNISESSVSLIENGKRKPSLEIVVKIAGYFKVTTDFLLGVSDSSHMDAYQSEIDISIVLENIIALINNQNQFFLDGKNVDKKTTALLKNNLNCILDNMRIITK
ncbi:MAG: helix-turn-helix domain-containing protein [Sedimentibacter sp.]